jgi:hypothetical protein
MLYGNLRIIASSESVKENIILALVKMARQTLLKNILKTIKTIVIGKRIRT